MAIHNILVFKPYPFKVGQKIRIKGGRRTGDWEVVSVNERKVKLRCPISHKEFEWERFCHLIEEREAEWPQAE